MSMNPDRDELGQRPDERERPDELVPDPRAQQELGGISAMCLHRWDKNAEMAAMGLPPPMYINGRKYRSRNQLEDFKRRLMERALQERASGRKERTSKPIRRNGPRQRT
jgi:hypothetical protein